MTKHKTFLSYHHENDEEYRIKFEKLFGSNYISKTVKDGEMDSDNMKTDTIRQKIRDEYLQDTSVTVVLVGKETWKRKHIDWEISSSMRKTKLSPRSGLLGIILPTYPRSNKSKYDSHTIPPRLYYNIKCEFATIHNWTNNSAHITSWIDSAFDRKDTIIPDNSYPHFKNNRSGERWQ